MSITCYIIVSSCIQLRQSCILTLLKITYVLVKKFGASISSEEKHAGNQVNGLRVCFVY